MNVAVSLSPEDVEAIARRVVELSAEHHTTASTWLTVEEAADYLRCSRQRVYDLASMGRLKCAKDGRRSLFRQKWLDALVETTTTTED